METTYADKASGGAFDFNCIPELTEISRQNENFSGSSDLLNGGYPLTGAQWTIAAMVAHSSGLPMKSVFGNQMNPNMPFFPNITNLGDILEENGYKNIFLMGSDATFGGRSGFLNTHGHYTIHDLPYERNIGSLPEDYSVWWGFEDEKLFDFAREELETLAQSEEPFNLQLLSVDTHHENGYVCRLCQDEFPGNQYANVMACSSRQVASFVDWVQHQSFYDNTTIVIVGDHTTMDTDFCNGVSEDYGRRVYTAIINSAIRPDQNTSRIYSTMDLFPTTLAALGVDIPGNRLGLGVNLYSSEQTLCEKHGIAYVDEQLKKRSHLIDILMSVSIDTVNAKLAVNKKIVSENLLEIEISNSIAGYEDFIVNVQDSDNTNSTITGDTLTTSASLNPSKTDKSIQVDVLFSGNGKAERLRSLSHAPSLGCAPEIYIRNLTGAGYDILIAANQQGNTILSSDYFTLLEDLGCRQIDEIQMNESYYAIIDAKHGMLSEAHGMNMLEYSGKLSNGASVSIHSETGNRASIVVNNVEYALNGKGLNFVVYDPRAKRVVDSSCFDLSEKMGTFSSIDPSDDEEAFATLKIKVPAKAPRNHVEVWVENEDSSQVQRYVAEKHTGENYSARIPEPADKDFCGISIHVMSENGYLYKTEDYSGTWEKLKETLKSKPQFSNELGAYLNDISEGGFDVIIAAKDEISNGLRTEHKRLLNMIGCRKLSGLTSYDSYYAILGANQQLMAEDVGSERIRYSGTLSDSASVQVQSAGLYQGNLASIVIDGVEYAQNDRGINIVVYDPHTGRVVDSSCFDTHRVITSRGEMRISNEDDGFVTLSVRSISENPLGHVEIWLSHDGNDSSRRFIALKQADQSYVSDFDKPGDAESSNLSVYVMDEDGYLITTETHTGTWNDVQRELVHNSLFSNELGAYINDIRGSGFDIIIAAKDDARNGLSIEHRLLLSMMGCRKLGNLAFRDSYYAILGANQQLIAEDVGPDTLKYSGKLSNGASVSIQSAGLDKGNRASIVIDNVEYAQNRRGLNFVIYDPQTGRVVDNSCFDTYWNITSAYEIDPSQTSDKSLALIVRPTSEEPNQHVEIWLDDGTTDHPKQYIALKQANGNYTANVDIPEDKEHCHISVYYMDEFGYRIQSDTQTWQEFMAALSIDQELTESSISQE